MAITIQPGRGRDPVQNLVWKQQRPNTSRKRPANNQFFMNPG